MMSYRRRQKGLLRVMRKYENVFAKDKYDVGLI